MTKKEIETIVKIMHTADGGCSHCAKALVDKLGTLLPQHQPEIKKAWNNESLAQEADDNQYGWDTWDVEAKEVKA